MRRTRQKRKKQQKVAQSLPPTHTHPKARQQQRRKKGRAGPYDSTNGDRVHLALRPGGVAGRRRQPRPGQRRRLERAGRRRRRRPQSGGSRRFRRRVLLPPIRPPQRLIETTVQLFSPAAISCRFYSRILSRCSSWTKPNDLPSFTEFYFAFRIVSRLLSSSSVY